MIDAHVVADEITRESRAFQRQVDGPRGVMAYLDSRGEADRCEQNVFASHYSQLDEEVVWITSVDPVEGVGVKVSRVQMKRRDVRRSDDAVELEVGVGANDGKRIGGHPDRSHGSSEKVHNDRREDRDERSYWAQKKAEKSTKIWEDLYSKGTVSTENAPAFGSESESSDDDVKPAAAHSSSVSEHKRKKQMKMIKKRDGKKDKKAKRR
uniref:Uncharacterized protein n=1 Tax=Peronospora matthiolae TaxID=2874970 RepID=A0AAV1U3C2_9STRA